MSADKLIGKSYVYISSVVKKQSDIFYFLVFIPISATYI